MWASASLLPPSYVLSKITIALENASAWLGLTPYRWHGCFHPCYKWHWHPAFKILADAPCVNRGLQGLRILALIMKSLIASTAFIAGALAQGAAYAQCGGQGWTGATTCVSGYTCTYSNQYYSQCLPGSAATTLSTSTTQPSSTSASQPSATTSKAPAATGGWKFLGVDESGAEFGNQNFPGLWGKDFIFPDNTALQVCYWIAASWHS